MLQRLEITGIHLDVDENLHKDSAHAEVRLKETTKGTKKTCFCEVTLHIPGDTITVSESTINMYAAVDIVESKLKNQIIKFRETHVGGKHKRHLFARFRRRAQPELSPEVELE
jgi:ribosomal subunit interface protein